jgi:acyl carrier protein
VSAPASDDDLLGLLRRLFALEFEIPAEEVVPEAHLVDDLDLDSVDAVSLAARLEEETGVVLEEEDLKAMRTVASIVETVRRRIAGSPDRAS